MLFRETKTGHMVDIPSLADLMNMNLAEVNGQYQEGEDPQDPAPIRKASLHFLSGEKLPRCWTDPHYRDSELIR